MAMTSSVTELNLRTRPITMARDRVVEVPSALSSLFPNGGLQHGSLVNVTPASVLCALIAKATSQGHWCSVVDVSNLFVGAIEAYGGDLERCVFIRSVKDQGINVLASLISSTSIVVSGVDVKRLSDARRLAARTQESGNILLTTGRSDWPISPFMSISVVSQHWDGIGTGHGLLQTRLVELRAVGRGAASKERRLHVWLPNSNGDIVLVEKTILQKVS
jgi:hypothetical protein